MRYLRLIAVTRGGSGAAAIIDRCDDLSVEAMDHLHGRMTEIPGPRGDGADLAVPQVTWWNPDVDALSDPWSETVWVGGVEISQRRAVRLRPSNRSDSHGLFFAGQLATVAGVFTDADGDHHVAVSIDDDRANEEFRWQGRYLFFHPDEVVPVVNQEQPT